MFKMFNKDMIQLQFCRNIDSLIASHNRRVIQPASNNHGFNCRNWAECLLDNKCLMASIVYKAVVSASNEPEKKYFGIAATTFKRTFWKPYKRFPPQKVH